MKLLRFFSPGISVMVIVASAIAANALYMQDQPLEIRPATELTSSSLAGTQIKGINNGSVNDAVMWLNKNTPDPLVVVLQKQLAQKGFYKGAIDGIYGSETAKAIRAYEKVIAQNDDGLANSANDDANQANIPTPRQRPGKLKHKTTTAVESDFKNDALQALIDSADSKQTVAAQNNSARSDKDRVATESDRQGSGNKGSIIVNDTAVTRVQEALASLGFAPGKIDGAVGPATRAAIQRFEYKYDLPITGKITRRLITELAKAKP